MTEQDKQKETVNQISPPFLLLPAAARYLGITVKTLYKYNFEKRIPYKQPARKCYYLITDLNDYIMKVGIKSEEQVQRTAETYFDHCPKGTAI
jgi:hypothetical protein